MFAAPTFELVTISAALVVLMMTSVFPFTSMYATLFRGCLRYPALTMARPRRLRKRTVSGSPEKWRERVPLPWATTESNLGAALASFGERETGTARLEQAVAAYRAALTEQTLERIRLDWAEAQMGLGNAFRALGERGSGTARLEEAVAAFQAALSVYKSANSPYSLDVEMSLRRAEALLGQRRKEIAKVGTPCSRMLPSVIAGRAVGLAAARRDYSCLYCA